MKNEPKPRQFFLEIALAAGLATAYFIAAKLGLRLAFLNASATAVWPPTGIALAAFLLLGRRAVPGIWLGAFLANLTITGSLGTSLAIATGNTLEGLIGAYLVNRFAHGRQVFNRPGDIFTFVILAALGSSLVSATIGVTSLALAGFANWADYGSIWFTWWVGDAVGAIMVTPLVVFWFENPRWRWNHWRALELSLLLLSLIGVSFVIFGRWSPLGTRHYPLPYLAVPFLVWAAVRFGQREVISAALILGGIALWGTLNGLGPFAVTSQNESLLLLQMFVGVMTITSLILASAITERNRIYQAAQNLNAELEQRIQETHVQLTAAEKEFQREFGEHRLTQEARRESDRLFQLLVEGVKEYAIYMLDPHGRIVSWNAGAERIKGYRVDEIIGQNFSIFHTPGDQAAGRPQRLLEQAAREGMVKDEGWRVRKDGSRFWADVVITALRDSQGQLRGFAKVTRDMTERRQAREALERQTRLYESLLKAQSDLGDGLAITEGAQIIYANPALSKIYGYSEDELLALPSFLDVVAPEERGSLGERLTQRLQGENLSDRGETVVIHKDGHRVYIEYAVKRIEINGKHQLFSIIRDITRRKLIEDTLRRREQEFRTLAENSPDIISRFDRQFRRIYVNLTIEAKTGIPWKSFIQKTNREVGSFAEDVVQQGEARLRHVFETGEILTFESDFLAPKGLHYFETRLIPERGTDGSIETILSITRDITERKLAEETLRRREAEFRTLTENSPDIISRYDRQGRRIYVNPIIEEKTGVPWRNFIGKTNREVEGLSDDLARLADERLHRVFETGQPLTVETDFPTPTGRGYFEVRLIPERGPDGSIETVLGITHDITEQKQAEEELRRQEAEFRTLTENSPDIIARFDRQGRRIYVNPTIQEKTGIPWQDFIGKTNRELGMPEDLVRQADERLRRVFETGEVITVETTFPTPQGLGYFETRLIPELGPDGSIETVLGVTRDITERKLAEEALRRREEEFRTLAENSPDIIARFDRQLRHLYVNPIIQEKAGLPPEDFIGKTNRELGMPEDLARFWEEHMRQVFETGQIGTIEFAFPSPAGFRYFESRLIPEPRPDGSIETILGVSHDITERKQSEAALQQANTRLMETVAELESFSYSVSHDLRAPLRVMQGFATTLLEDYGNRLDAPGVNFARRIIEAAQHMDRLIQDLLTYSRLNQTELNLEPVDLTGVVASAITDLQAEIEERNAQITVAEPLPRVMGHAGILIQIIQNLISNAVKFVPPEAQPQVHLWAEEIPLGVRLWVEDNGLGIAAEYHERIFRIFERLHNSDSYPGTGVGLALVSKGIERLGGRVGVESQVGQGSRFWLELLRVEDA